MCARGLFCGGMRLSCAGLRSFYAGRAFLLECLVLVRAHHTFLPKCFMLDHACCLPHERQTGRLAICSVPVPPWVVIAGSAFSNRRCGYRAFLVHFGRARFLWRRSRRRTEGRGERSRRRDRVRFCVTALALSCFPRGVRWGYAPQTAPKSHWLSGLSSFDSRRGCVSRRKGLECITETCSAPISGGRTAAGRAGRVMLRGSKWKPHSGLPGLSSFDSRRGCVSRGEGRSGTTET